MDEAKAIVKDADTDGDGRVSYSGKYWGHGCIDALTTPVLAQLFTIHLDEILMNKSFKTTGVTQLLQLLLSTLSKLANDYHCMLFPHAVEYPHLHIQCKCDSCYSIVLQLSQFVLL